MVIAIGLVVLGCLERSRGLWVVVSGYAAAVLLVNAYFSLVDWQPGDPGRFSFMLVALLPAPILLIGGGVALFATATRRRQGTPA